MDFTELLPDELSMRIFSFLGVQELGVVCSVCKIWKSFAEDDQLWTQLCQERFLHHILI